MKSLKLIFSVLFLAAIFILTSCGDDGITDDPELHSLVGEWNVDNASAIAYIDGLKLEGLVIETSGSITYLSDGKGLADFTMTFDGETSEVDGDFEWKDTGFEIVWNGGDRMNEIRWSKEVDEPNRKVMTFTHEIDESGTNELEVTAVLSRIN